MAEHLSDVHEARQARTLLSDPTLNVFDNPEAYLTCNYDPSKALCHPDRGGKRDAPSLDRCVSTCANIARTDTHAKGLENAADRLRQQADSPLLPTPVADRLRARCGELQALAEGHRDNNITPDRTTAADVPDSTLEEAGR